MTPEPGTASAEPAPDSVDIGPEGFRASPGDHIVHFYERQPAARELLLAYLKAGLRRGDRCVHVLGAEQDRKDVLVALDGEALKVDEALSSGQLILGEGHRRPADLEESLRDVMADVPDSFPFLRWSGEMTWALQLMSDRRALMEWETACNLTEHDRVVFLCQYALPEFSGRVVLDALRTHPICIVGRSVQRNSLYVDPEEYLERLEQRETGPASFAGD